jgi:hypothetical protein
MADRKDHSVKDEDNLKLECSFWLIVVVGASFAHHHGQTDVVSCMKSFFFCTSIYF